MIGYTDNKFVICMVNVERLHRECFVYWELNLSLLACVFYRDRIK